MLDAADASNDAVIALDKTYPGCEEDRDGLCPLPKVVAALQARMEKIDYDKACSKSGASMDPQF